MNIALRDVCLDIVSAQIIVAVISNLNQVPVSDVPYFYLCFVPKLYLPLQPENEVYTN